MDAGFWGPPASEAARDLKDQVFRGKTSSWKMPEVQVPHKVPGVQGQESRTMERPCM